MPSLPLLHCDPLASCPVGVPHNPDAVPDVRCANGRSGNAVPLRIIPERGQVSENVSKSPSKQSCDVLHEDVARSHLANDPGELGPQSAALAADAGASSGNADVLAGESAADEVNAQPFRGKMLRGQLAHVVEYVDIRPVPCEHAAGERLDLAERHRPHAGTFEAEAEGADAAEQVEDADRIVSAHTKSPTRSILR